MNGLVDWLKAIGLAGFLFFLIKGLVWCVVFWLLSRGVIKKQAIATVSYTHLTLPTILLV